MRRIVVVRPATPLPDLERGIENLLSVGTQLSAELHPYQAPAEMPEGTDFPRLTPVPGDLRARVDAWREDGVALLRRAYPGGETAAVDEASRFELALDLSDGIDDALDVLRNIRERARSEP